MLLPSLMLAMEETSGSLLLHAKEERVVAVAYYERGPPLLPVIEERAVVDTCYEGEVHHRCHCCCLL